MYSFLLNYVELLLVVKPFLLSASLLISKGSWNLDTKVYNILLGSFVFQNNYDMGLSFVQYFFLNAVVYTRFFNGRKMR